MTTIFRTEYEGCRGCPSHGPCLMAKHNINGDCPCSYCLVKKMCLKGCSKFANFGVVVGFIKEPGNTYVEIQMFNNNKKSNGPNKM